MILRQAQDDGKGRGAAVIDRRYRLRRRPEVDGY
jgi:hypothetical protein